MNTLIQKRGLGGLLSVLFLSLTAFLFTACNDDMDVQQAYPFTVETMPVPTRIVKGETVEIRCELKREGRFSDARYTGCITLPHARTSSRLTSILRTTANRNSCSCSVLISTTKERRRLKRKRKGRYLIPGLLGAGIRSLL